MNSIDAPEVVSNKTDLYNRRRNLMAMQVAVTLIWACSHSSCCHCRIGSSHCAIDDDDDCSSHRSNCHLANGSLHNAHLDPSLENMDAPRILVAAILDDADCNEHAHDVCCVVLR